MRIYELSKQLDVGNKDILDVLPELGIVAKSHASSLSPEEVKLVMKRFRPDAFAMKKPEPPRAATAPEPAAVEPKAEPVVEALVMKPETVSAPAPQAAEPAPRPAPSPVQPAPAPAPATRAPAPAPASYPHHAPRHRPPQGPRHRQKVQPKAPEPPPPPPKPVEPEKPVVMIRAGISVKELAEKLSVPTPKLIGTLMKLGVMASINQRIPVDIAELAATEYGFKATVENLFKAEELTKAAARSAAEAEAVTRPPIVTIMGHVDHGKTKLLDTIRKANVVEGEAGGITQHVGAYTIEHPGRITFIDTPGHEAFTAMRARGASVTDIVVLVVAADDGIMPQTEEAIHHAQAAGVTIMVAINKCDLPAANIDRVMKQLSERNLQPEEWGGSTITVPVSAKLGTNVDKLLEMILLQAEMMELKAPVDARAKGIVIEARLDKARGPLATVLVQSGTLNVGDTFVCGLSSGKVRALFAHDGTRIESAGPATPVQILGFSDVPLVGDSLQETDDEREARFIAQERATLRKSDIIAKDVRVSLEDLKRQIDEANVQELAVVVKADAMGSVEAIRDVLERISDARVRLRLLHGAVGAVNDNDINLASASNALVVCFNVRCILSAETLAKRLGIEIRYYEIIYKLEEDIRKAMQGLLAPTIKETVTGHAEVRETFKISKVGLIAGSYVRDGLIRRGGLARVLRDGVVIYTGRVASLKHFKDDVREVKTNFECGIGIENFNDVKVGDVIESFTRSEVAAELSGSN